MDSTPTLKALGIDPDLTIASSAASSDAVDLIGHHVAESHADELDTIINHEYRQAGTICYTTDQFKATEHGKQNANSGLYELTHISNPTQKPTWGTECEKGSPNRPLAGLKVVDLTRVIAGPSISKGLAEWGASVMRVTGPDVKDIRALHPDLNWGKWNCSIDLKTEAGKEQLRDLIREADVVLDGYRPGVIERLGFGRDAVLKLVEGREHGIIYARENCYGWHGPWQHRSGWQQISDAVSIFLECDFRLCRLTSVRFVVSHSSTAVRWAMKSLSPQFSQTPTIGEWRILLSQSPINLQCEI